MDRRFLEKEGGGALWHIFLTQKDGIPSRSTTFRVVGARDNRIGAPTLYFPYPSPRSILLQSCIMTKSPRKCKYKPFQQIHGLSIKVSILSLQGG